MPRRSSQARSPARTSRSRTAPQARQRATAPGASGYTWAWATAAWAPQEAHWPIALVTSTANTSPSGGKPPRDNPAAVFVCGPTGFVEAAANLLIAAGYQAGAIKTERFGPSGG